MKEAVYIRYVIVKLSEFIQINTQTSSDYFLQIIFSKLTRTWNYFPGLIFRIIFDKNFFFCNITNWPNFITGLSSLPKLYSEICFVFDTSALMTSWHSNIWKDKNLIISRTKQAFKVKQKIFFLLSQVLSFRLTKQTSTNIMDKTFKKTLQHNFQMKKVLKMEIFMDYVLSCFCNVSAMEFWKKFKKWYSSWIQDVAINDYKSGHSSSTFLKI